MKLTKTKKIILLLATLGILTISIVTPIVLLNKDEKSKENDVEKLFKILKAKTTKEKIIELPSDASGKIIANNQEKIIEKIKTLIGTSNLKKAKIEVSMQNDTNISTIAQKIIIKLTKNKISKEIKDFSVKRNFTSNEDIRAIKEILDAKTNHDLIITLSRGSIGNIIGNVTNKNEIIKKLRILIDPLNTNGEVNHSSLRRTSIDISMSADAPISTIAQDIIVSISKTGGTTLRTTNTFQVKRHFTAIEDVEAIKSILKSKSGNDLLITLSSSSTGSLINNPINKDSIERKVRILIDPLNTNGDPNHPSLRGTIITLTKVNVALQENDYISADPNYRRSIIITVSKSGSYNFEFEKFVVTKSSN